MSQEKRKSKRIERNTAAALISVMGEPIIECVLRDISATGACISVEVPEVVPDYFFLKIEELGEQLSPKCRVRWRSGTVLGVEFFRLA
jgi:PilZ domain